MELQLILEDLEEQFLNKESYFKDYYNTVVASTCFRFLSQIESSKESL